MTVETFQVTDNRAVANAIGSGAVSALLRDDDDSYASLVAAGRTLANTTAWMLGDLADAVETKYGENRLAEYARDIEINYRTLLNARTVSRAFPESSRRRELSFGAAQALAALPDRQTIVERKPHITVSEARAIARDRKAIEAAENVFNQPEEQPDREGDDSPPDYESMLREVARSLKRVGKSIPVASYGEVYAEMLDKAANSMRRKLKAAQREGGDNNEED